jgi:8-oxo-dGTP pyrophosphatase MutT (NUDIX family)
MPLIRWNVLRAGDRALAPSSDRAVASAQLADAVLLPEAEEHRRTVAELVDAHPDVLLRTCLPGHLTGSGVVVDPVRGRSLLMLHRKLGRWFQPGGHADGDANLAAVALREASEETGIEGLSVVVPALDVDVHEVPMAEGTHLHLDVRFLVLAPERAEAPGNHESLQLAWVDAGGLEQLRPAIDPSTRRVVRRALELGESFR